MELKDFEVGDRVRVNSMLTDDIERIGTILMINSEDVMWPLGIEFDENLGGHNLGGRGKDGHCWWIPLNDLLEVITAPNINLEPTMVDQIKSFLNNNQFLLEAPELTPEEKIQIIILRHRCPWVVKENGVLYFYRDMPLNTLGVINALEVTL